MVWDGIFLDTATVSIPYVYLALCVSSSVTCLCIIFAYFSIELLVSFLLPVSLLESADP